MRAPAPDTRTPPGVAHVLWYANGRLEPCPWYGLTVRRPIAVPMPMPMLLVKPRRERRRRARRGSGPGRRFARRVSRFDMCPAPAFEVLRAVEFGRETRADWMAPPTRERVILYLPEGDRAERHATVLERYMMQVERGQR